MAFLKDSLEPHLERAPDTRERVGFSRPPVVKDGIYPLLFARFSSGFH